MKLMLVRYDQLVVLSNVFNVFVKFYHRDQEFVVCRLHKIRTAVH